MGQVFNGDGKVNLKEIFTKQKILARRKLLCLVPSTLHEEQIHTLRHQLFIAGIHQEEILPLNIALAPRTGVHLVISSNQDLCDITVVKNGDIIAGGSVQSIERELDGELSRFLRENLSMDAMPEAITDARSELTTFFSNDGRKFFLSGVNLNSHTHQNVTIDGRDFYSFAQPSFKKLVKAIKLILKDLDPSNLADLKPNPILVFGDLFNAPGVLEFFHNELQSFVKILTIHDIAERFSDVMEAKPML